MFKKILIANRGEIAVRVIRACKEWGIATVAVHSDVDRDSMHVRLADESVCIGSHQPANSYLNIPALMSAIELTKTEAVHPGYGFLSENANFAKVLEENNIKFIGASSKLIEMMGDKIQAKKIAKEHGLPVIEGSEGGITDIKAAKELCRNTKGPVASIFYQGLDRVNEGVDSAEKAVVAYGGVQMGQLEKNVSWSSLFIALAPMLGFMGTVIGMIQAFDKIEAAGDMQPSLVAGGIKGALLTTVFGLIVAIILQVFYNYIIAKIDSIVNDMEDASINLIDILVAQKK